MLYNKHEAIQKSKKFTKKVGVRSIYDIINDPNKSNSWKINYIRHHYVYYDGNYDLFYDIDGHATQNKKLLDSVILGIIKKTIDPNELSTINKTILAVRKEKDKEIELKKQAELDSYVQATKDKQILEQSLPPEIIPPMKEDYAYKKGLSASALPYTEIIDKYLDSLNPEDKERALTWSYKDLKKVSIWWNKCNMKNLPAVPPSELLNQRNAMQALLNGYRSYAKKEWKNTSDNK